MLGSILASAAPALIGGLMAGSQNDKDNKASAAAAAAANAFTEKQLQNRHQWEVDDLRKAGLNPILSTHAAPSIGSSAQQQVFSKSDAMSKGAEAANSAARNSLTAQIQKEQIENLRAQSVNQRAQAVAAGASANYQNTQAQLDSTFRPWESGSKVGGSLVGSAASLARGAQNAIRALRTVPKTYSGAAGKIFKSQKGALK